MLKRLFMISTMAGIMALTAVGIHAETITTSDGVLSIETPTDGWKQTSDANHWFSISDGANVIAIDHLSNGERLPSVQLADNSYAAVINSFVSTRNEVFVIKALATSQEALKTLAPAIASVTIHKFDTKTAIASNNTTQSNGYTIQSINATYYVTADVLMVRSGAGETYPEIGRLSYGDAVQVKGKVMNNGMDTNWYLISYNGMDGYTSSQFYSATALNNGANPSAAQSTANDSSSYVCDQCGQTFLTKGDLARHLTDVHNVSDGDIDTTGLAQCPFCLSWFNEGTDFRNHVMAAHPDKNANSPEWNDVEENYEKDYEEEEDYE